MAQLKSPVDILRILEKSNCRECGMPTCMAFAAAVFTGAKKISDCPRLDRETLAQNSEVKVKETNAAANMDQAVAEMKEKIKEMDLSTVAGKIGGEWIGGRLRLKIMGKDFWVDPPGNLSSAIHLHSWVTLHLLSYVINCQGIPLSGEWVSFRELRGGFREKAGLFRQSCEVPLKKVADRYTDLFKDMIEVFNGQEVGSHFDSDISMIIKPLPLVPILICYWKPEEGLESDLKVFFDSTADRNAGLDGIYGLGAALTQMFSKIAQTHG